MKNYQTIPTKQVPPFPVRMILDTSTACNLKCKMCLLQGSPEKSDNIKKSVKGIPIANLKNILEEVKEAKPLIQPSYYGEPLMAPDFQEIITLMKNKGFALAFNTNGTLFDKRICRFFVDARF